MKNRVVWPGPYMRWSVRQMEKQFHRRLHKQPHVTLTEIGLALLRRISGFHIIIPPELCLISCFMFSKCAHFMSLGRSFPETASIFCPIQITVTGSSIMDIH